MEDRSAGRQEAEQRSLSSQLAKTSPSQENGCPDNYEEVSCLLCGSRDREFVYKKMHLGHPIYVQRCKECDLIYFSPRPNQEFIDSIYQDDYFNTYVPDYSAAEIIEGRRYAEERRLKLICQHVQQRRRLIEVGSGFGAQLEVAARMFDEVIGIEPNPRAVEHARNLGYEVFEEGVDALDFSDRLADVIVMYAVIEHLPDPLATLKRLRSWLAPGGILAVQTPNEESLALRWQGIDSSAICIDHLCCFGKKTLERMLVRAGFEVVRSICGRGLTSAEEFEYAKIMRVGPLEKSDPRAAEALKCKLYWLTKLRAISIFGYSMNVSVTCFARNPA